MIQTNPSTDRFVFSSSIAAEAWRPNKDAKAYEWWYFDALSDDGREAVVIVFLDNFVYSPRLDDAAIANRGRITPAQDHRFPAVAFTYFADGKIVYQAEQEFEPEEFIAGEGLKCRIANCGFRFESASYGSGFLVSVDLPLAKGKHLRANLEWLSVESDLLTAAPVLGDSARGWNMSVPRSDVSGKIIVEDDRKRTCDTRSFRGTGYHDHNVDNRWLAETVREWHWGRAHFSDSTAVFCRYAEDGDDPRAGLILVREGGICQLNAEVEEFDRSRDKLGIHYPTGVRIIAEDGTVLETRSARVIDSSFHHLRFLSTMELTAHGHKHSTTGITEFIAPRALKRRWFTWLSDLRSGKNGGRLFR